MAGKWVIQSISVTFLRLFDVKAPNLIPDMVLEQSRPGGDIAKGIVELNTHGYSQNVHKMYRYGKNTYTGSLPLSTSYVETIDKNELNKACQIECRKHVVNQIPIQQRVADALYNRAETAWWHWNTLFNQQEPPADPAAIDKAWADFKVLEANYYLAQDAADYTEVLSTTLTTEVLFYDFTNTPNPFWKGWEAIYSQQGLWVPVTASVPLDGVFFENAKGQYPHFFVESISNDYDPVVLTGYNLNSDYDTKADALYYQGTARGYPNPPTGEWHIQTMYRVKELLFDPNQFVFNYNFLTQTYPNIASNFGWNFKTRTRDGEVVVQTSLPIVKIRDEKTWVDIDPKTQTDIGKTTTRILSRIQVDLSDVIKQFDNSEGIDDIESVYILFGCPMISLLPSNIRYWIRFFEVLRENIPIEIGAKNNFPWDDDNITPGSYSLEQSTNIYRTYFYNKEPTNAQIQQYFKLLTDGYTYKTYLAPRKQWDVVPENEETEFTFTFRCGFIYRDIIKGSIGKIGTTHGILESLGVVPTAKSNINAGLFAHVEYQEQIDATHYKVVRVLNPVVQYQTEYGGNPDGEGRSNIDNQISLVGTNAIYVDPKDPYNFMRVPLNYDIVKTFSGNTETKIYYDSLGLLIFSIVIEWIPGWKTFLQILLFIVLILVIIFTGQIELFILAVVALVGTVLSKILALVLTAEASAKAAIAITVITAILSFGTSLPINLLDLASLLLQLLGVVTNIIASIQKMDMAQIADDFNNLTGLKEESDAEFEEARNLLNPQNIVIDPLMVGGLYDLYETPDEYFANRLRSQPLVEVFEMVHTYVTDAIILPEFRYADNTATTTTTSLGVLPRTI